MCLCILPGNCCRMRRHLSTFFCQEEEEKTRRRRKNCHLDDRTAVSSTRMNVPILCVPQMVEIKRRESLKHFISVLWRIHRSGILLWNCDISWGRLELLFSGPYLKVIWRDSYSMWESGCLCSKACNSRYWCSSHNIFNFQVISTKFFWSNSLMHDKKKTCKASW